MATQADDLDLNGAGHEGADADLGDRRRTKRLVERAQVLAQHPTAALPEACGEGARLKAASRFFAHDDIAPYDCRARPSASTSRRLDHVSVVWAVQETTARHGTRQPATTGWGLWAIRPVKASMSLARWPAPRSGCLWGCGPRRCGPVTPTTWARARGPRSCPCPRRPAMAHQSGGGVQGAGGVCPPAGGQWGCPRSRWLRPPGG